AAPTVTCSTPAKRRPNKRYTLPNGMKATLHQWVVNHMDNPYPKESDRIELTAGQVSKQNFKWWFSNHRSRSLNKYIDAEGSRRFTPKPSFVKTCLRHGISIPPSWALLVRPRTRASRR
ncbi:hypothetical protein H4R19_005755, partial [Coemansia spiralis]